MESCTFAFVKKSASRTALLIFFSLIPALQAGAQRAPFETSKQKNALTFNIGQYLVNEINLGYEHFFSEKKSFELSGGFIYRNELLIKQAEDWSNSQYFYEHGFAVRLAHKIYHNIGEKSGKKYYYSFGLNYQYLYFNDEWFKTDRQPTVYLKDSQGHVIDKALGTEDIYQRRYRNRIGAQFLLGNIFPMGNTFAIEIYYGIGVRGIMSNRYDVAVSETGFGKTNVYPSGTRNEKFYIRPSIHAGAKLRIGW